VVVDGDACVVVVVVSACGLEVQALTTRVKEVAIDPIVTRRQRMLKFTVAPLGHGDRGLARPSDGQQPRQENGGDGEEDCEDDREAIEVLLDDRRTAHVAAAHTSAEHVSHASTLASVKKDQEDQAK